MRPANYNNKANTLRIEGQRAPSRAQRRHAARKHPERPSNWDHASPVAAPVPQPSQTQQRAPRWTPFAGCDLPTQIWGRFSRRLKSGREHTGLLQQLRHFLLHAVGLRQGRNAGLAQNLVL